jgi:hypothetical protein
MMRSWMLSSGMRLSFVIAMKSHLGLMAIVRSFADLNKIKGVEARRRRPTAVSATTTLAC